jgi:hypothetical protein
MVIVVLTTLGLLELGPVARLAFRLATVAMALITLETITLRATTTMGTTATLGSAMTTTVS